MTEGNEDGAERSRDLAGTGPSIGRLFLERLLLSLIDAHPNPRVENLPDHLFHDREARLRAAMNALFNERVGDELPDHSALLWMAQQHVRDRTMRYAQGKFQASDVKPRSERQLAQEASKKFYPRLTDRSERLRKKRRRDKNYWIALVRWGNDIPEVMEGQALIGIWLALARAKVPVVPNWPAGHAMSEEQMLRTGLGELTELLRANVKRGSR